MTTEPSEAPEPEVVPSSTPDGPTVVPTHGTPEGEPGPNPDDDLHEIPFDNRESNPNSGGREGLAGDMGVSSERTGPDGPDPRNAASGLGGAAGTGTKGSAAERTDGEFDSSTADWDGVDVSQTELHEYRDPRRDDTSGHAAQTGDQRAGVDRTVGEPRPNPIEDEKSRR